MKQITLSVVMPAYNEGIHIYQNLLTVSSRLAEFCQDYEIIAVNDGSTDDTDAGINRAAEKDCHIICLGYSNNHGKGHAIATGIRAAKGRYIAFLDSDLELPPTLLENFLNIMDEQNADIVIGSKQHPKSQLDYPLSRRIMSYGYYIILKILFHMKIHDTQTGIKLFKNETIKPIIELLRTDGYAFDIEILAIAQTRGCVIEEAPIILNYSRNDGKQGRRIKFSDIWHIFTDTLRIKKNIKSIKRKQGI